MIDCLHCCVCGSFKASIVVVVMVAEMTELVNCAFKKIRSRESRSG
jgi:hypothetical protein